MCIARQRAATGAGDANRLRRAPVMPTKIMSWLTRVPRPMRPPLLLKPSPNGMNAAIHVVWSRVSLIPMCSRRNEIEPTAVIRCTPWATIRCRVLRISRSCATSPQITEQVRRTSVTTPAPKLRKSWSQTPPYTTTRGMASRKTAVATP